MKLQFDAHQEYQLQAIQSIIDLFEGQPLNKGDFEISFASSQTQFSYLQLTEKGVGNQIALTEEQILQNLNEVQQRNGIPISAKLDGMNFTVEMETGTGKTYVYLRTIYELHKHYGFQKFVIVVPSIAIREGVLKNLVITHEHFQNIYKNIPLNYQVYNSSKLSGLRTFAISNAIQVLVINIDSFAKEQNVINQVQETGVKPIEYIQATNPIVIIDEPQNMETERRKEAIANLHPVFTLRYSATHKHLYNLVYRLTPVGAYNLGLVKQIGVSSIISHDDYNSAYVKLEKFNRGKKRLTAKISIYVNDKRGVLKKSFNVRTGVDLYELSQRRDAYRNRFYLNIIHSQHGYIEFSNGVRVYEGNSHGGLTDAIMQEQIKATIKAHLDKELRFKQRGEDIKVLSLFFIDRVASYREYDNTGKVIKGKLAQWFEERFHELTQQSEYRDLYPSFTVERVHNGYFSQDKRGRFKDTTGKTEADNDTFQLIMRDKERLLDNSEPLRFIFSHSALREGWDNPNVFQICTLNETQSDIKKRQEIGRGLRLPVNNDGERVFDEHINRLTVIANESYDDFAGQLQREIEEETGVIFDKSKIKNEREKRLITLKKGYEVDSNFLELWEKIKYKTVYRVEYDTQKFVENASQAIEELPAAKSPILELTTADITMNQQGVSAVEKLSEVKEIEHLHFGIPDVFKYIQNRTNLTKQAIFDILQKSGRIADLLINPQAFLDAVLREIKRVLNELMIDGIKYEKIAGQEYEMRIFEDAEIEAYLSDLIEVKRQGKTLYNYINVDSSIENQFAKDCESRDDIEFYFKLPPKFTIPTPIGMYNPDWALTLANDKKIYFVAETKSTKDTLDMRPKEAMKIECGREHFKEFEDVEFKAPVTRVSDLLK